MLSNLSPKHILWMIFLLFWSISLCFIRLFNLLSFEFALACTLPLSFCGAHLGISLQKESENLIFKSSSLWQIWLNALKQSTFLTCVPLVPICLNAIWVQNCNWTDGFLFYGLLSVCSAWIGSGWGVLLGRFNRGMGSFCLLFILTLLYGVGAFLFTPAVDVFSTFIGYYPGAIYDEQILIGHRLIWSRGEDLAWIICGLAFYDLIDDPFLFKRRFMGCLSFLLLGGIYLQGFSLDLHRSADHIQARLGGFKQSPHFQIYYPQKWTKNRVQDLSIELEFAYQELKTEFNLDVSVPIHAYFYSSPTMKKRLMGAGRTLIAKPWQYALHIHQPHVGDASIIHELAHVFSAEIAQPPHHLSLYQGWLPHMSLIEGLAVAFTWAQNRLDPHQWSAVLYQLNRAPPMKSILSPQGFYAQNSKLAYTLCGSFVRFYREQKGQDALNLLYRQGSLPGGEKNLDDLINQWTLYLQNIPLSSQAKIYAKHYLNQPSIFYKVCAHEVANIRNQAFQWSQNGQWIQALEKWEKILEYTPYDPQAVVKKGEMLYMLGQNQKLKTWIQTVLQQDQLSSLLKSRFQEWQLDLQALDLLALNLDPNQLDPKVLTQLNLLKTKYMDLLQKSFQRPILRRLAVKIDALAHPFAGKWVLKALLQPKQTQEQHQNQIDQWINQSLHAESQWSIPHYLKGRMLMFKKDFDAGLQSLDQSLQFQLPHPSLSYEVELMKARHAFNQRDYQKAHLLYMQLLERKDLDIERGERFVLKRWSRRTLFFKDQSPSTPILEDE